MRKFSVSLFIIYLIILLQLVLFKGWLFYHVVHGSPGYRAKSAAKNYHHFNLIPFRTIHNFLTSGLSTSTSIKVDNILGNIVLFIPFGFLLPVIFTSTAKFKYALLASAGLSFCFELYQFLTHTGEADIDDIILNTLGGMMGYSTFLICKKIYRLSKPQTRTGPESQQ